MWWTAVSVFSILGADCRQWNTCLAREVSMLWLIFLGCLLACLSRKTWRDLLLPSAEKNQDSAQMEKSLHAEHLKWAHCNWCSRLQSAGACHAFAGSDALPFVIWASFWEPELPKGVTGHSLSLPFNPIRGALPAHRGLRYTLRLAEQLWKWGED